ncbi:MFS transporter [Weissella confusa]|uniref:MFS transporter n=1 Tax=Weissella fermenti TaxID=2987699 RepID=A0ABT6D0N5_9LACO|nr:MULTISPECIES: MFS transporter [Weissella]MBJ7687621.1 MFS transporter [Weissella confusa]MCW0926542.1 MFS transporter [Weissella sp. LMG 11983]MDF9298964.1 MFS transporter [Weissella sp. BK2]
MSKYYKIAIALAVSTFAIGTTEFVPVGMLTDIAKDMHVSTGMIGLLVTGYAIAQAVGAPIVTSFVGRIARRRLFTWLMFLFAVLNVASAVAPSYGLLLVTRALTAVVHGVFFATASVYLTNMAPLDKKGEAASWLFGGLTVATVFGVPFGTYLGDVVGWRATFAVVGAMGLIGWFGVLIQVPKSVAPSVSDNQLLGIITVIRQPRISLTLLMATLGFGATFVLYTYIRPYLQQVTGISTTSVVWVLVLYGVFVTIGNVIGGRLANRQSLHILMGVFLAQSIVQIVQLMLLPKAGWYLLGVALLGLVAFMGNASLQSRIIITTTELAPAHTDVASALNVSALNFGIAGGSLVGNMVMSHVGLQTLPIVGALIGLLAIGVAQLLRRY